MDENEKMNEEEWELFWFWLTKQAKLADSLFSPSLSGWIIEAKRTFVQRWGNKNWRDKLKKAGWKILQSSEQKVNDNGN